MVVELPCFAMEFLAKSTFSVPPNHQQLKKEKELSKRVRIDVIKAGRKIVKNLRPPRKLAVPDTVEVDYNTIYFFI